MVLDNSTAKRLAFIRYLHTIAVEQSKKPEPLSCTSILMLHDSIELFLQLSYEHLNGGKADPKFLEYWDIINSKLNGKAITQKESIRRLNDARVSLKHHGNLPSKLDIEGFRASALNFFEDNTPIIFGVSFKEISLVELVQCVESKDSLKRLTDS